MLLKIQAICLHTFYTMNICSKQYLITPKYKPDELTLTINHILPYARKWLIDKKLSQGLGECKIRLQ